MKELIFQGRHDDIRAVEQILASHSIPEYELTEPERFDGTVLNELFVTVTRVLKDHWVAILAAIAAAKTISISVVIKGHTYNIGDEALKHALTLDDGKVPGATSTTPTTK